MAGFSLKRKFVIPPEGYHPVKIAKCAKSRLAGQHLLLGNTGAGCAIDDVYEGDEASFQTRGLVSVDIPYENAKVGEFLYAVRASRDDCPDITLTTHTAISDKSHSNRNLLRPWGIVLQRGPQDYQRHCTVRAFKFPGPFVVHNLNF